MNRDSSLATRITNPAFLTQEQPSAQGSSIMGISLHDPADKQSQISCQSDLRGVALDQSEGPVNITTRVSSTEVKHSPLRHRSPQQGEVNSRCHEATDQVHLRMAVCREAGGGTRVHTFGEVKDGNTTDKDMFSNSSSFNVTLAPPAIPSSLSSLYEDCLKSTASKVIFTAYTLVNLLLLPLYTFVLYMGFQRWRLRRSASSSRSVSSSRSDTFTFHLAVVEIAGVLGSLAYTVGMHGGSTTALLLGVLISSVIFPGQTVFHCLTCVEHYLAVVHPISYMRQRENGGRVRNASIMCVWLLCVGWVGVTEAYLPDAPTVPLLCILGVSSVVMCFCCLSILRALTHPGPGGVGGNKERVDQSKRRAFHLICTIMGAMTLKFVGLLFGFSLSCLQQVDVLALCVLIDAGICLSVPSSLVLPLLFLHRTGNLACCRGNHEPGS